MYYHPSNLTEPQIDYQTSSPHIDYQMSSNPHIDYQLPPNIPFEETEIFDWSSYMNIDSTAHDAIPWAQPTFPPAFQRRRSSSLGALQLPYNNGYFEDCQQFPCIEEETVSMKPENSPSLMPVDPSLSYSPFSLTSTDTHLTSPPQQHSELFPEIDSRHHRPTVGKRRRSSSVPPSFQRPLHKPHEPLIFAQVQVADPRPRLQPPLYRPPMPIDRLQKTPGKMVENPQEIQQQKDDVLLKACLIERLQKEKDQLLSSKHSPDIFALQDRINIKRKRKRKKKKTGLLTYSFFFINRLYGYPSRR
ncbi:hypothetical protein BDF14DRAFT_905623 [Spinellus fusiger]|nr:hypothetical protein BDF14DRAFT_905623 [Spinellus fusiger]